MSCIRTGQRHIVITGVTWLIIGLLIATITPVTLAASCLLGDMDPARWGYIQWAIVTLCEVCGATLAALGGHMLGSTR